ncbi:hypothetical protein C4D60_Mb01t05440 [Musa balbisiana]|uniref:Uncharacterized protein n=1 Tax=Musa balbisiana TaxID=52838 RepID=A0A4V4H749_MUSBA|nr:hypothetical protein C4D60_Mb01t05440 [Musa balbisiana]
MHRGCSFVTHNTHIYDGTQVLSSILVVGGKTISDDTGDKYEKSPKRSKYEQLSTTRAPRKSPKRSKYEATINHSGPEVTKAKKDRMSRVTSPKLLYFLVEIIDYEGLLINEGVNVPYTAEKDCIRQNMPGARESGKPDPHEEKSTTMKARSEMCP